MMRGRRARRLSGETTVVVAMLRWRPDAQRRRHRRLSTVPSPDRHLGLEDLPERVDGLRDEVSEHLERGCPEGNGARERGAGWTAPGRGIESTRAVLGPAADEPQRAVDPAVVRRSAESTDVAAGCDDAHRDRRTARGAHGD